jgi:hypothetical protein
MIDNKISMEQDLNLTCYECLAKIRFRGERPDIHIITKLAKREGKLTTEAILTKILPNRPEAMANNLIRRYKQMGYLNADSTLTELGELAAKGDVYTLENGTYYICGTGSRLVPQSILSIERKDNLKQMDDNRNRHSGNSESVKFGELPPEWKNSIKARIPVMLDTKSTAYVVVEEIEKIGRKINPSHQAALMITIGENYFKKEVTFSDINHKILLDDTVKISLVRAWDEISEKLSLDWMGEPLEKGFARVTFSSTKPAERASFVKSIKPFTIKLGEMGEFKIRDFSIKIMPAYKGDAEKWAFDLIVQKINNYINEEDFEALRKETNSQFTESGFAPSPAAESVISVLRDESIKNDAAFPKAYWHLQAVKDLVEEY